MSIDVDITVARDVFTLRAALRVETGSVVAVLGPNGSGKTTLLRSIAGLQPITSGRITVDGQTVDDGTGSFTPPRARSVGMVFQDFALFPHLDVRENVAFGLRSRGQDRRLARASAEAALDALGLLALADRRPTEISGGQAQRVALARALATDPAVLLLDEPMASLDVESRDAVRAELGARLATFGGSTILVTHDPLDALLLADRVVVIEAGQVVQDGTPADLAHRPRTPYVAALMGVTLLRGSIADDVLALDGGGVLHLAPSSLIGPALCVVRPETVTVHRTRPEGSARNVWPGTITALQPAHDRVRLVIDGQPSVTAVVTPGAVAELGLGAGTPVWLSVKALELSAYPG